MTSAPAGRSQEELAAYLISALIERKQTVAMAESLTGGLLTAALVEVPGASAVLRGGVVAYATRLKHDVLGVDQALLDERGPVDAEVAAQMASGVRALMGADWGISTTGVAGPGPQDGVPAGRAFIGLSGPGERVMESVQLDLDGEDDDRDRVRAECVRRALNALAFALSAAPRVTVPEQGDGSGR